MVLQALQKGRVFRPLPPREMLLRHKLAPCVLLQGLFELEYLANDVLALHGLFWEAGYLGS